MSTHDPADTPVVILCGGMGTRIREASERLPKPLIDIGGKPMLWHIMKVFGHYGYRRFVLCLGYKAWDIKEYFLRYRENNSDFTVGLAGGGSVRFEHSDAPDWEVTCVDTGLHSGTGGRVPLVRRHLDRDVFVVTYGDGIADIDARALLAFHDAHDGVGTVTGVRPASRYGELGVEGEVVSDFAEKPVAGGWVSGGFFVFDHGLFDYMSDDPGEMLERAPLRRMAHDGELRMRTHTGFWLGMDTYREYTLLNQLWADGKAPWKVWTDGDG